MAKRPRALPAFFDAASGDAQQWLLSQGIVCVADLANLFSSVDEVLATAEAQPNCRPELAQLWSAARRDANLEIELGASRVAAVARAEASTRRASTDWRVLSCIPRLHAVPPSRFPAAAAPARAEAAVLSVSRRAGGQDGVSVQRSDVVLAHRTLSPSHTVSPPVVFCNTAAGSSQVVSLLFPLKRSCRMSWQFGLLAPILANFGND